MFRCSNDFYRRVLEVHLCSFSSPLSQGRQCSIFSDPKTDSVDQWWTRQYFYDWPVRGIGPLQYRHQWQGREQPVLVVKCVQYGEFTHSKYSPFQRSLAAHHTISFLLTSPRLLAFRIPYQFPATWTRTTTSYSYRTIPAQTMLRLMAHAERIRSQTIP